MIEVYSNADSARVGFYRSLLEDAGIRTFFRNEFISGAEVVVPIFYPAICVLDPADEARALALIRTQEMPDPFATAPDWVCAVCGEAVPSQFAHCWNCSAPAPEPSSLLT
jgi:hypothetical protein